MENKDSPNRNQRMTITIMDTVSDYIREQCPQMVIDLMFAVVWVTGVSIIFEAVDGPQWAYYLFMAAGVIAYFSFFTSLEVAREQS